MSIYSCHCSQRSHSLPFRPSWGAVAQPGVTLNASNSWLLGIPMLREHVAISSLLSAFPETRTRRCAANGRGVVRFALLVNAHGMEDLYIGFEPLLQSQLEKQFTSLATSLCGKGSLLTTISWSVPCSETPTVIVREKLGTGKTQEEDAMAELDSSHLFSYIVQFVYDDL